MVKLDLHDLQIKPNIISHFDSRRELDPFIYYEHNINTLYKRSNFLPLITAPMDTVINETNYKTFIQNGIHSILPRNPHRKIEYSNEVLFMAYGLDEFIQNFISISNDDIFRLKSLKQYVLIDIANGHMLKLHNTIKKAKHIYGDNMTIMAGNVANPETYRLLSESGASYVRVGIGNGNACLTTKQTSVGHPMASLIQGCKELSKTISKPAKIIADGGMKSYSDIIMSLALGADLVMVGSLLNKCLESCGQTYLFNLFKVKNNSKIAEMAFKNKWKLTKVYRGMSTKEVQKTLGNKTLKTSEGIVTKRGVEYKLSQWVENFESYLRTAMSYTNCKNLNEFKNNTEIIQITQNAYKRMNK